MSRSSSDIRWYGEPNVGIQGQVIAYQCRKLTRSKVVAGSGRHRAQAGKMREAHCVILQKFRAVPECRLWNFGYSSWQYLRKRVRRDRVFDRRRCGLANEKRPWARSTRQLSGRETRLGRDRSEAVGFEEKGRCSLAGLGRDETVRSFGI